MNKQLSEKGKAKRAEFIAQTLANGTSQETLNEWFSDPVTASFLNAMCESVAKTSE